MEILLLELIKGILGPSEVETLLGDSSLAKEKLGWEPKKSLEDLK